MSLLPYFQSFHGQAPLNFAVAVQDVAVVLSSPSPQASLLVYVLSQIQVKNPVTTLVFVLDLLVCGRVFTPGTEVAPRRAACWR